MTVRVTRNMVLRNLAPDIQEQLLDLHRAERGRDVVNERDVRPITAIVDWRKILRSRTESRREAGIGANRFVACRYFATRKSHGGAPES